MCRSRTAIAVVIACVGVIALSLSAVAQSELRIVRPVDGATVRETVSILIPVSCVPMNPTPGFIACSIDGVYEAASAEKSEGSAFQQESFTSKFFAGTYFSGCDLYYF